MKILNIKNNQEQSTTNEKSLISKILGITAWLLFLASFGFAGGGYFLLFLVVPFEEVLVNKGWTQNEIDDLLSYFVYGWIVFSFFISFLYYRYLVKNSAKRFISNGILLFVCINAVFVLYMFTNTNTALISMAKGNVEQVSEQFTFGPYPDGKLMEQLKEEKYDGIITLLSTTLVFEKQLLDDELKNGEKNSITVHSFPMLPWVGDNKAALDGIKELIKKDPSKRYYVHCYLGKHRVDMVRQIIINEMGIEGEEPLTILPSDFERGNVYSFKQVSLIVGPYPTDEEWFILFRRNVQEIISTMDSSSKWFAAEKKIAEEQGIKLTLMPLDSNYPDLKSLRSIVDYANKLEHPVYIHGFSDSNSLTSLNYLFRNGKSPIDISQLKKKFSNDLVIGTQFILSSYIPSEQQLIYLKKSGIETVVVMDKSHSFKKVVVEAGLEYYEYPIEKLTDRKLFQLAKDLATKKSTMYIVGSNQVALEKLQKILIGMTDGLKKATFEKVRLPNGQLYVIDRDMMIGPDLNKEQWSTLLVENGVTRVLLLHAASLQSREMVQTQKQFSDSNGQTFEVIKMDEKYLDRIITLFTNHDETTYLIVPEEVQSMVIEDIRGVR